VKGDGVPSTDALVADLELLGSMPLGVERNRVLRRLPEHGPQTVEVLRRIRRAGPGRLRRAALEALVYLGGEAALDATDLAAIERLIRVKQRRHEPHLGIDACWNSWLCVPTGDQRGVMALLGLTAPRPATWELADSVILGATHGEDAGFVFVTPEVNGWTAVIGPWCDPDDDDRHEAVRVLVERLSDAYGEAHAFTWGNYEEGSAWLIARRGRTVRRYSQDSAAMALGDPLPIERAHLDRLGIPGAPEDHHGTDDEAIDEAMSAFLSDCSARHVAAALSLDTVWGMPTDAVVSGRGLLARVPGAAAVPIPPGPHRI
jgi:hypothetical protein